MSYFGEIFFLVGSVIIGIYLLYNVCVELLAGKQQSRKEEEEIMAAMLVWLEDPSEENEEKIQELIDKYDAGL